MSALTLRVVSKIDPGIERDYQEDNFIIGTDPTSENWRGSTEPYTPGDWGSLLVVADGMGGLNAGEVASQQAVEGFQRYITQQRNNAAPVAHAQELLVNAIHAANNNILNYAQTHTEAQGMGTTIVAAWIVEDQMHVAWSGDSRCYRYSNGQLQQINSDHSYVQELVDKGEINPEDAFFHPNKNIITQSLGDVGRLPAPDYRPVRLQLGDRILLCSDGLNTMLTDEQIASYLAAVPDIRDCADQLVQAANDAGGYDNITVVLAEVLAVNDTMPAPIPVAVSAEAVVPAITPAATGARKTVFKVTRGAVNIGLLILVVLILGIFAYVMKDTLFPSGKPVSGTVVDSIATHKTLPAAKQSRLDTPTTTPNYDSPPHSTSGAATTSTKKPLVQNESTPPDDPDKDFRELVEKAINDVSQNSVEKRLLRAIQNDISSDIIVCEKIKILDHNSISSVKKVVDYAHKHRCSSDVPNSSGSGNMEISNDIKEGALKSNEENNKLKWGIQIGSNLTEDAAKIYRKTIKNVPTIIIYKKIEMRWAIVIRYEKSPTDKELKKINEKLNRKDCFIVGYRESDVIEK